MLLAFLSGWVQTQEGLLEQGYGGFSARNPKSATVSVGRCVAHNLEYGSLVVDAATERIGKESWVAGDPPLHLLNVHAICSAQIGQKSGVWRGSGSCKVGLKSWK